jgi:hypothetical protein
MLATAGSCDLAEAVKSMRVRSSARTEGCALYPSSYGFVWENWVEPG